LYVARVAMVAVWCWLLSGCACAFVQRFGREKVYGSWEDDLSLL
jgi:hypothetical protein